MLGIASVVVVLSACSSSTDGDAPAFKCALGELRGTWRLTYVEKSGGTCGPVAEETVVLTGTTSTPAACQQDAVLISDDKCRMDLDFTCPVQNGSQQWAGATRQVAEDKLIGDMTAQVTVGAQSCRSTYEITWTRQ